MSAHKIKIIARIRPKIQGEVDDDNIKIVNGADSTGDSATTGGSFVTVANPRDTTQIFKFPFSSCYDHDSTQEEIYQDVAPLLDIVYSGVTVTIFAYGVTSSGKTYTMQGTKTEPGVIPRVVRGIFEKKETIQNYQTTLSVSYMEIYKDDVYDLFVTRENAPKLPVRENDSGMVFVANLTSIPISNIEEFESLYNAANKHRSVGATNLNRASSRSHAILTIEATMLDTVTNMTLTGKIKLVDLAGSENNKLTGNDPSRMAESAAINKSLSVLGQVIHALNQGASRIPYRNSKLTRILQDALGGTSVGLLVCNIAPGTKFRQDTLNTLNFAVRTKNVENRPVIHERDNRPAPKAHFAAVPILPSMAKPATAVLQAISTTGSNSGGTYPRMSGRQSLVPVHKHRMSLVAPGSGYQPFVLPAALAGKPITEEGVGLTAKEIDERIAKAVEVEVARRLAEREKQRQEDEEANAKEAAARPIPSDVLTPLLKRHKDLDNELIARLHELERKYERGSKETQLADALSPVSRKKTGRAYVSLARAHSEKGDLQVALDLYRKAETYVPDNIKLKERIIEIEWAAKHGQEFVPSPKAPRKTRSRNKKAKTKKSRLNESAMDVDGGGGAENGNNRSCNENENENFDADSPLQQGASKHYPSLLNMPISEFGMEVTNNALGDGDEADSSPNLNRSGSKRSYQDVDHGLLAVKGLETPVKKQRRAMI